MERELGNWLHRFAVPVAVSSCDGEGGRYSLATRKWWFSPRAGGTGPRNIPVPALAGGAGAGGQEHGVWLKLWRQFLSELDQRGKLDWSESFLDGSFAPAKRGRVRRQNPARQRHEVEGGGRRPGCSSGKPAGLLPCRLPHHHPRHSSNFNGGQNVAGLKFQAAFNCNSRNWAQRNCNPGSPEAWNRGINRCSNASGCQRATIIPA